MTAILKSALALTGLALVLYAMVWVPWQWSKLGLAKRDWKRWWRAPTDRQGNPHPEIYIRMMLCASGAAACFAILETLP